MKTRFHGSAGAVILFGAVLLTAEGAGAAETFCVDAIERPGKPSEWALAEHVDGTVWNQPGSDTPLLFVHRPTPDAKMLWPSSIELGLYWPTPELLKGVPKETLDLVIPLQFVTVTLFPPKEDDTAVFRFERTGVKLTGTGEFRTDLNQIWRYELRPTDDCLKLTGHITMFKPGEDPKVTGLKMPVVLTRAD